MHKGTSACDASTTTRLGPRGGHAEGRRAVSRRPQSRPRCAIGAQDLVGAGLDATVTAAVGETLDLGLNPHDLPIKGGRTACMAAVNLCFPRLPAASLGLVLGGSPYGTTKGLGPGP